MDYVFKGNWSGTVQQQIQSWITNKWSSWGEDEVPGAELVEFIKVIPETFMIKRILIILFIEMK
jgi:hypothetical protein